MYHAILQKFSTHALNYNILITFLLVYPFTFDLSFLPGKNIFFSLFICTCLSLLKSKIIMKFTVNLTIICWIWIWIKIKGFTKISSHIEQHLYIKVISFIETLRWSTKASFTSKRVNKLKFSPHNNSSSWFFTFVNVEGATLKIKMTTCSIVHHREYSLLKPFIRLYHVSRHILWSASIHK